MIQNQTIGITGGIGSGKSIVARVLRCNGYTVYDCDSRARHLMNTDPEIKEILSERYGREMYSPEGNLNRNKLASIIFSDTGEREFVNHIVHSSVRTDIDRSRQTISGLFFIESAILATGGIADLCDWIWLVETSEKERIKRVRLRDNLTEEEIKKRINSQKKELLLLDRNKTVIMRNDDRHPLLARVLKLTEKYNLTNIITC